MGHDGQDRVWKELQGYTTKTPTSTRLVHPQPTTPERPTIPTIIRQGCKPETLPNMQETRGKHPSFSALPPELQPSKSMKTMLNTILKDNHPSKSAIASCIALHLERPGYQPSLPQPPQWHKLVGSNSFLDTCQRSGFCSAPWIRPKLDTSIYWQDKAECIQFWKQWP